MTMMNKRQRIAICGGSHALGLASAILAGNSHCSDPYGSVIELEKAVEYQLQPAPSDFDEQPKPPSAYRNPRSKYAPHIGAKELRRLSENIETTQSEQT